MAARQEARAPNFSHLLAKGATILTLTHFDVTPSSRSLVKGLASLWPTLALLLPQVYRTLLPGDECRLGLGPLAVLIAQSLLALGSSGPLYAQDGTVTHKSALLTQGVH